MKKKRKNKKENGEHAAKASAALVYKHFLVSSLTILSHSLVFLLFLSLLSQELLRLKKKGAICAARWTL